MAKNVKKKPAASQADAERPKVAARYRIEWDRRQRLPAVADVLSGRLSYLDTCRKYDVQSNQLYAWAGKAIINAEHEAISARASNGELMQRLNSLAAAGVPVVPTGDELARALGQLMLRAAPADAALPSGPTMRHSLHRGAERKR